jgi:hypothetical protein
MFGTTIQLAVHRNRLRVTDPKSGTVLERPAVHEFSAPSMLIADREMLQRELFELLRQLPRSFLFRYPAVEVVSTEAALQPVEREALERAIVDSGASEVIFSTQR